MLSSGGLGDGNCAVRGVNVYATYEESFSRGFRSSYKHGMNYIRPLSLSLSLSLVFLAVDEFLIGARALKLRRKNEMHYIEGRVESLRDSVAKGKGGAQVSTHSFTRLSCLLLLLLLVLFRVRGGKEVVGSIGGITSLSGISCVSRAKLCVQFR